jgi:hypothetical protein
LPPQKSQKAERYVVSPAHTRNPVRGVVRLRENVNETGFNTRSGTNAQRSEF